MTNNQYEVYLTFDYLSKLMTDDGIKNGQLQFHQAVDIKEIEVNEDGILHIQCELTASLLN